MFCIKCGNELEDGDTFCPKCGTKAEEEQLADAGTQSVEEKPNISVNESLTVNENVQVSDKKKSILPVVLIGIFALLLVIVVCVLIARSKLTASTMRLSDYTGEVTLINAKGKELELSESRRLLFGDRLGTEEESKAWVLLDEERMVTLMELSSAEFLQQGKDMRLNLTEGRIFFNIERPLEDDESFEIRTSTMAVGIRGTSGYIDSDEKGNSVLYLTSGKVVVSGLDDTGAEAESEKIYAGEKITVIKDDDEITLVVEDITEYDLPVEAVSEIISDKDLLEAVTDATGWDSDILKSLDDLYSEEEPDDEEDDETADEPDEDEVVQEMDYSTITDDDVIGMWYYEGEPAFELLSDGIAYQYQPVVAIGEEGTYNKIQLIWFIEDNEFIGYINPLMGTVGALTYCTLDDGSLGLKDWERVLTMNPGATLSDDPYDQIVGDWALDEGETNTVTGFSFSRDNTGYVHTYDGAKSYTYAFEWGWGYEPGYIYITVLCGETHPGLDSKNLTAELSGYSLVYDESGYVRFSLGDDEDTVTDGPIDMSLVGTWDSQNDGWPDLVFFENGEGYCYYAPNSISELTYETSGDGWSFVDHGNGISYSCYIREDKLHVTGWGTYDRISYGDYYGEMDGD